MSILIYNKFSSRFKTCCLLSTSGLIRFSDFKRLENKPEILYIPDFTMFIDDGFSNCIYFSSEKKTTSSSKSLQLSILRILLRNYSKIILLS